MKSMYRSAAAALALVAYASLAEAESCSGRPHPEAITVKPGPLTLADAIRRAGHVSPDVLAAALDARAADADAAQAARWTNPSLSVESENFSGSGALTGFSSAETTYALEQTFRLGNKRALSTRAARARSALASAECLVRVREAETLAGEFYLELQAAMAMATLAESSAKVAEDLAGVVAKRVEAGAAAPPELARARADAAALRAAADAAQGDVEAHAFALASIWGSAVIDFELPAASVTSVSEGQNAQSAAAIAHPGLTAANANAAALAAEADLAKAAAYPDVSVSGGLRTFEETGDNALVAGISVPLPVFDRNRDGARAAQLRQESAEVTASGTDARFRAEQAAIAARARGASARLRRLEGEALPLARKAYDAAVEGYRFGKFDLTSTLDARRSLIEIEASVIEARLTLETETLRLQSLIGAAPFAAD